MVKKLQRLCVILAAGRGTRMKSILPKVLHEMGGRTLIEHVLHQAFSVKPDEIAIVVPENHLEIKNIIEKKVLTDSSLPKITFVTQKVPKGTGHALRCALEKSKMKTGDVIVLNGDMPLLLPQTLRQLLKQRKKSTVSILTAELDPIPAYGRIIRDGQGRVIDVVEEKDCSALQKKIHEVNVGVYVLDLKFARDQMGKISSANAQNEYYITDYIRLAARKNQSVFAHKITDTSEAVGVNSQEDLFNAESLFYERQRRYFRAQGVTISGEDVRIDAQVEIDSGVRIEGPCWLRGKTCVGSSALIKPYCYLDSAEIASHCQVGPFVHLRPETKLMDGVKIGNFVELKKSHVGKKSKVNHLSYIGDAEIGAGVNVGAGTITCNYDGFKKFKTILEDGVFVGSDTQLVAPVRVGQGAYVGAGTTVTRDVKENSLVISRVRQREIPGWATRHRNRK